MSVAAPAPNRARAFSASFLRRPVRTHLQQPPERCHRQRLPGQRRTVRRRAKPSLRRRPRPSLRGMDRQRPLCCCPRRRGIDRDDPSRRRVRRDSTGLRPAFAPRHRAPSRSRISAQDRFSPVSRCSSPRRVPRVPQRRRVASALISRRRFVISPPRSIRAAWHARPPRAHTLCHRARRQRWTQRAARRARDAPRAPRVSGRPVRECHKAAHTSSVTAALSSTGFDGLRRPSTSTPLIHQCDLVSLPSRRRRDTFPHP